MKPTKLFSALLLLLLTGLSAMAQVKVGANPTVIGSSSNLEVEAANGNKTIVNKATGQVTIQDGTQGAGKVLVSDATGASSWQALTSASIPELVFAATQPNTTANLYAVPLGVNSGIGDSRIPFAPFLGTGYNSTTREYLIPSTGFYRVTGGIRCTGTVSTSTTQPLQLVLKVGVTPSDIININAGVSLAKTFTVAAQFNAGDAVYFYVDNVIPGAAAASCFTGFLTVEKLQ